MSIDLNAPEVQEAVKTAVAEAVKAATEALAGKNKELIDELKKARKDQAIDPAVVDKLEAQVDSLKNELNAATTLAKTANANAEKMTKQLESETNFTQKLLVDNGLSDVLVKAGVSNPAHLKAVKSMLANQVKIVTEGDQRVAKVGDKALDIFVSDWAKSEEGKNFVTAPNNSGGGGGGGKKSVEGKTMSRTAFDALDPLAQSSAMKEQTVLTD